MTRIWPLTLRGTGAVVFAIACFVLAGELGVPELVYFGCLLLAIVAAALVSLWATRRTDSVERSLSTHVATVGRRSTITVDVGVRTALPSAPGRWSDHLPPVLRGRAEGVFPALHSGMRGAGERTVPLRYEVTGDHRGTGPIGPLRITATDPFGLARRRHVLGTRTAVTVVPALVDLPPLASYLGESGGALTTTTSQLGQGTDNLIARRYSPGDSMRRIHWRATAHRDELMVRQEEQESAPEAAVILDRTALRWTIDALRAPGVDPGFEAAIQATVSAASRLASEGYRVEITDSDGAPLCDPLEDNDDVEAMLSVFASVVAHRDDNLARLAGQYTGATTGPVVVIVGRFDPADAEILAPMAHHSSMPLLFAVAPVGDALARAARAGWHCAHLEQDGDLAATWRAVADRESAGV